MSAADVSRTLAAKLAGAELTNDEANLLVMLIEGETAEVEGFIDKSSPKIQGFNIGMPPRLDPQDHNKWIDVLSTDWGVEKPRG